MHLMTAPAGTCSRPGRKETAMRTNILKKSLTMMLAFAMVFTMTPLLGVGAQEANAVTDDRVQSLSATPHDGSVEVGWTLCDGEDSYSIFRRDGHDADKTKPDLSKYVLLGTIDTAPSWYYQEDGYTDPVFSDHFVENNKEYSYIVLTGYCNSAFDGEPSKSVSVTPKAARRAKPSAPYGLEGNSAEDMGYVHWNWDSNGGHEDPVNGWSTQPESEDGKGYIDHFNVYRNGRLYKQVMQNVVSNNRWEASIALPQQSSDYTIRVTAVDLRGNESLPSNILVLRPEADGAFIIGSHYADYYVDEMWDDDKEEWVVTKQGLAVGVQNNWFDSFEIWKKSTASPDSSYKKTVLPTHSESVPNYQVYFDENIDVGKSYTYKFVGHSSDGRTSEPYVFSTAAYYDKSDDYTYALGTRNLDLSVRTSDGESARLDAFNYGEGTYRLYRDGAIIKTWSNADEYFSVDYTDSLSIDGNYNYQLSWTSKLVPSLVVYSNPVLFCRDTSDVDEDELEKAPGAPRLTGRITEHGDVIMSWTPDKNGGKVDGYIIYRTDNGIPNEFMWKNTWDHPLRQEDANGRYISRPAGTSSYTMTMNKDWAQGGNDPVTAWQSPHEFWIVAYNEMGVSEASAHLVYSAVDGSAPAQEDDQAKPGAPENVNAWYEWYDYEGYDNLLSGKMFISWDPPSDGNSFSSYVVKIKNTRTGRTVEESVGVGGSGENKIYRTIDYSEDVESGETYSITVEAKNTKGSTSSSPVILTIDSTLAFRIEETSGSTAELTWYDLHNDRTQISKFEVMRRVDKSPWTAQDLGQSHVNTIYTAVDNTLTPGKTYEYYIAATDANGKVHNSAVKTVATSSRSDPVNKPTNFRAEAIKGDVIFGWTPPAEGASPVKYILEYQTRDKDPDKDSDWLQVELGDDDYNASVNMTNFSGAFGNSTGAAIMSWQYDDNHTNGRYDAFRSLRGRSLRLRVRARKDRYTDSEPSNVIDGFIWPAESSVSHDVLPDAVTPIVIEGDRQVTLKWKPAAGSPSVSFYQILKTWGNKNYVVFTVPASDVRDADGYYVFTDRDTDLVNGSQYTYELRPCNSGHAYDAYGNEYWFSPLSFAHAVTAVPSGDTIDKKIADNVKNFADDLIKDKPDPLSGMTDEYHRKVYELKANYEDLSDYQKKLIGKADCAKIENFINEIVSYDAGVKYRDDEAVTNARNAIEALKTKDQITLADENNIKNARRLYDALPNDARILIDNYSKLTDAEAKIKELKRNANDEQIAAALSERLNAIDPDSFNGYTADTLPDEMVRNIADLRWEYDNLTKNQKNKVVPAGIDKLARAEERINIIMGMEHVHEMKVVSAKDPTCTEAGNTMYYTCKKCGKNYLDKDGKSEITSIDSVVLPADLSKHDWSGWAVKEGHAATCTTGGIEERHCRNYGCTASEERSAPATGHSWDDGVITREATQTEEGIVTFTCNACHITRTATISHNNDTCTSMSDHRWGKGVVTKEATCREHGLIEYKCTICNTAIKIETDIDPLAHTWSKWTTVSGKEATCTHDGVSERHCLNNGCTEKETRIDEMIDHNWKVQSTVEPGCSTAGSRVVKCSMCESVKTEILPATGNHHYGDWEVIDDPTCTEVGVRIHACNDCDYVYFEAIEPLGHAWDNGVVTKQPDVGVAGVRTYKCTRCGAARTEGIPALSPQTPPAPAEIQDLPAVKISKPKAGKKKVTVKWKKPKKKVLKQIQGIEIRVTGPGVDKTTTAGKKKTSKKVGGLTSKQKYTVQVRAYKFDGGVKHVSAWKSKSVKVK